MAALVEIAMVAVLERRLVVGDGNASIVSASRSLDGVHGLACAHTSVYHDIVYAPYQALAESYKYSHR